jgi:2-iminobutanoate/2-iminopropanoate deaminase
MKEIISTTKAPAAVGPYSQAVKSGNTLFVSGQIPLDPTTGDMAAADIEVQTKQVLDNLTAIIEAAGYAVADVVKCTCFLTNMNAFSRFNGVYEGYFTSEPPARECVEVSALPKGALVEVSAICMK